MTRASASADPERVQYAEGMSDRRDDALSWDGDDDPTLDAGRAPVAPPTADDDAEVGGPVELPEGFQAVGKGAASVTAPAPAASSADAEDASGESDESVTAAPLGNAALISLGVIGGIYLLYAIGWIIGGLRVSAVAGFLVSSTGVAPLTWSGGNVVGVWLAAAAPAIWFVTVILLTRGARAWIRWVWLAAGVILLVPWPLLMAGMTA